jgi:hypothetical protein
MQLIGGLVGGLFGKIFGGGPKQQTIQPPATVTRDDAASAVSASDALARRQGSAADILTGTRGAEALSGSTGKLVLGN